MTIFRNHQLENFNNSSPKHLVNKFKFIIHEKLHDRPFFFYFLFIDTNNDGLVNWTDFEAAIEVCLID